MRKILSGFLATAMIVSVGSMATLAATPASKSAYLELDIPNGLDVDAAASVETIKNVVVEVKFKTAGKKSVIFTVPVNEKIQGTAADDTVALEVSKAIAGKGLDNIEINGKRYDFKFSYIGNGTDASTNDLRGTFSPAAEIADLDEFLITINTLDKTGAAGWDAGTGGVTEVWAADDPATVSNAGAGGTTADVTALGDIVDVSQVIECDSQGNPIPLTEGKVAVDSELNGQNGVQSGNTLYFMIKNGDWKFNDDSFWKLRISKGNNAKYVKAYDDVTKNFSKDLYNAVNGSVVEGTSGRHRFIKVELNEIFTDDEYKITLDLRFTPKSAAENQFKIDSDTELKVKDFSFWMKNMVKDADNDWKVGISGLMLNPLENDWNEVTYFDEDGDLAFMKFFADSDVSKFYAKLSTKWEHADYASYFNDQDAYIFDFVGSPKISATSRCDLQIYNPFVNDNGDETIDPSTAVIYQVIDGDLFDVTDSFKYEEGENGEMAYTTRTRFLGTYIICEKAVEEAVDESEVPEDLTPEENVTPEVDVTPDNNNGGKAPANTGKFA